MTDHDFFNNELDMRITYLVGALTVATLSVGCVMSPGVQRSAIQLGDTSLIVIPPHGLVPVHWEGSPPRVLAEFNLPEGSDGGTPAYPDIYIERLDHQESGASLDDYMQRVVSKHLYGDVSGQPKEVQVDGVRAFNFVAESQSIADFADGRSAIAFTSHHEIAFWRDGATYRCVLETAPDIDPKYVSVYEDFCSTIEFKKTN